MNKMNYLDFSNTQIAFAHKSDKELQKMQWLFFMMSKSGLVTFCSKLGLWAIKKNLPLAKTIVKHTFFSQFCGGTSLENCRSVIGQLAEQNVGAVLDYGGEAKDTEEEFLASRDEIVRAIHYASDQSDVKVVSMKITGLIKTETLTKMQVGHSLSEEEEKSYRTLLNHIRVIGYEAEAKSVSIFVDAEESWFQDVIDELVDMMMARHNKSSPIIYNTYQMYRHDRLHVLKAAYDKAKKKNYILGAKLVRGAYMEKERQRAEELRYPSPIHKDKAATDHDYNAALKFCIVHHDHIATFNASHNQESNQLLAQLIAEHKLDKHHPHLNFCQLYGMSDQITFNLSAAGYNAMKYIPYGSIKEVIPYLIRRAQENTAVSGDMSREYRMIISELKRRKRRRIKPN